MGRREVSMRAMPKQMKERGRERTQKEVQKGTMKQARPSMASPTEAKIQGACGYLRMRTTVA